MDEAMLSSVTNALCSNMTPDSECMYSLMFNLKIQQTNNFWKTLNGSHKTHGKGWKHQPTECSADPLKACLYRGLPSEAHVRVY